MIKNLPAMQETQVQSLGWEGPLEKGMATPPVFLPGEFQGQRSLANYSPWDHKESVTTEQAINCYYWVSNSVVCDSVNDTNA